MSPRRQQAAALLLLSLALATPAAAQPVDDRLKRAYIESFRVLGRAKACNVDIPAEPHFAELIRRHGEGSEYVSVARIAYNAIATNSQIPRDLDPKPPAPMPCDVVVYMKEMKLPSP